ncbi:MAG TPA: protein translocase subunit SecD [Caulobacteraceae bacterium]|jgi:preprotein translocase subunit SecD|nr:protein translocase subunit SecD [Caulobacteraceae bacterium]
MIQLRRWKVILVVLAALFGVTFTATNLMPPSAAARLPAFLQQRLNLGLDLQGGSYLLFEVDTDDLKRETLVNLVEEVRRDLQTAGIAFTGLGAVNGAVQVHITDPAQAQTAFNALGKLAQPLAGAAGGRDLIIGRNGQDITLKRVAEADTAAAAEAVTRSIEVIRRRIDSLGTKEPTIVRQGINRIVVQAPGESDPEKLRRIIGQTAKLTFQMVDETTPPEDVAAGRIPPSSVLLQSVDGYETELLVQRRVLVSGEMLTNAFPSFDQSNRSAVSFAFNGQGARRFGDASSANIGKRFAIVLDDKVISAPTIQSAITGGSGQITGNFTPESANELALLLKAGALPAKLKVEEQRTVGAELGADAVRAGTISLAIGAVGIFVFIIFAYGLFGVFAAVALLINILLLVAVLTVTQATLTLPGIAGLILTLAVAVDANVLIYERMRDETRDGHAPLASIDKGYKLAMVSIFDANVTTLISAVIMFGLGSGPVKGFAWTLGVGVLTSLFTALLITQVLIGWWFKAARPKTLPI